MPEYKLIYFNLTAHAEPIRWIFKYAKVPLAEERIEFDDWESNKSRFPVGQVPILLEDGEELSQALAIGRYLGKKFGLTSGDDLMDYRVDQVVDTLMDARLQWVPFLMEQNTEKKEQMRKNLEANVFPKYLRQLNGILEKTKGNLIADNKLTFGDFWLASWLEIWSQTVNANLLDDFPSLIKQKETVLAIPEIKAWVDQRPTSNVLIPSTI